MTVILYCKDHRRRPIRFGSSPLLQDVQGAIPAGWCCVCGSEVFTRGENRCMRCRNAKGER